MSLEKKVAEMIADKLEVTIARACGEIDRLRALNAQLLAAIEDVVCPECEHLLKYHAGRFNCEMERGDGYRNGSEILEALGPCGCECIDFPDLLSAIAAIRKARGIQ